MLPLLLVPYVLPPSFQSQHMACYRRDADHMSNLCNCVSGKEARTFIVSLRMSVWDIVS